VSGARRVTFPSGGGLRREPLEEDVDVCQRGKSTISEYSLSSVAIDAER
jgi:hypothetical protein